MDHMLTTVHSLQFLQETASCRAQRTVYKHSKQAVGPTTLVVPCSQDSQCTQCSQRRGLSFSPGGFGMDWLKSNFYSESSCYSHIQSLSAVLLAPGIPTLTGTSLYTTWLLDPDQFQHLPRWRRAVGVSISPWAQSFTHDSCLQSSSALPSPSAVISCSY